MHRSTLVVLAGVVTVLVIVAVYRPGLEPTAELPKLTTVDPASITRIVISRGNQKVTLQRVDGRWQQSGREQADTSRVPAILRLLQTPSHARYPAATMELARYRLDPPRMTVRFDGLLLSLGTTDPIHHQRYVLNGDTLHLVDDLYYHHLATMLQPPNDSP